MPLPRLWLASTAVLISVAFAVVGGACLPGQSTPPPVPSLHDGRYVLITAGAQLPPQVTFTDATGRRIRVLADTIVFETGARHYTEHGSIAITPAGGTEQAPTPIALGTQTYTATTSFEFDLPVTIAGAAHGIALSDNALDLRMTDGSHWTLNLR
jgi:hypothetical protein